ncbi:MAG: Fe-S cluster assembly protein SufD [Sandaracinaceae bacterium]|nr:Fe-S cluster assembly protein SufD [Sandaracinaceae bacterium]
MADGLLSVIPKAAAAGGPGWLSDLRALAITHLEEQGFPGKKNERWRFTSVRDVVDTAFEPDPTTSAAFVDEALGDDGTWRVVLAGGRPLLGDAAPPDGVSVRSLADVLATDPDLLEGHLGAAVATEQFAALNGALFTDGVVVHVAKNADVATPVHLVHVATPGDAPRAVYPRVVLIAEPGSRATVVESFLTAPGGSARHLTNTVAEVSVGANARVEHVRITDGAERSLQLAYLGARLDRDAFYGSRVVALGGALTRLELFVRFEGPGAEVELDGVYHVDDGDHVDHQLRVDHVAGRCTSHVRYRGLLDGRGHAVFNAMGIVHRDAAGSAAHQENRNLLLSDDATIDTKPHLEIDCDDVKASHGSTIGALDAGQLFYLRSRAIPEREARDILTFAFVREILDRIGHASLVARTSEAILARLPHGEALREGLSS